MKESTKERLLNELKSGEYRYGSTFRNPKYIDQLFEIYLEEEMDSVTQFLETFNVKNCRDTEFYKFVLNNIAEFQINSVVLEQHGTKSPEDLLGYNTVFAMHRHTRRLQRYELKDRQKFVNIVNEIVRDGRLLDVGSGADLPVSSLLFARDRGHISSMDNFKSYWLSYGFLNKMGIDAKGEYLNDKTDISSYDVLVGQRPCSAIIPIVTKCANSDEKEYFIEMCDCSSPRNGMQGFVEYLMEKDERLKSIMIKKIDSHQYIYAVNNVKGAMGTHTVYITNSDMHGDDILASVLDNSI